jgi:signal transduction histidine kinase
VSSFRIDTLVGRTTLVLIIAIATVQVVGLSTYRASLNQDLAEATEQRLATRLLTIKRTLSKIPEELREDVAHDLSSGAIEAHWSETASAARPASDDSYWAGLQARLAALAPELAAGDLIVGEKLGESADPHVALISLRLDDGSWLNVSLLSWTPRAPDVLDTALLAWLIAIVALSTAVLLVRWISKPLARFAAAAEGFYKTGKAAPVPESGPREVAVLARAFNELQRRLAQSVEDRTHALAAVSHDLRTPITRLRFRMEEIGNDDLIRAMGRDLDDMERMIDQTLSYLRGDRADEPLRPVDVVAIAETVTDDFADAGGRVTLDGDRSAVVLGRRLGLKRAIGNLVTNAVNYGETARVRVTADARDVVLSVEDDGPGIPEEDRERVCLPFVRLEGSRNSGTGGFGLGLAIAKAVVDGHGGTLKLERAVSGGLRIVMTLPKAGPETNRNVPEIFG